MSWTFSGANGKNQDGSVVLEIFAGNGLTLYMKAAGTGGRRS